MENTYGKLDEHEKGLFDTWVKSAEFAKVGLKTTVCLLTLSNGFEQIGTSACVNPDDFNPDIGKEFALKDALAGIDAHAAFFKQCQISAIQGGPDNA